MRFEGASRGLLAARSLRYDDLAAVRIGRSPHERIDGRPVLVLERRSGPPIRVASVGAAGALHELAELIALARRRTQEGGRLRVLIAGGGIAALEATVALRALADERVEIELLAPRRELVYRPLAVAEPFGLGRVGRFELGELAGGCGARFRLGALAAVDPERRLARTRRGAQLAYDALLIACGARARDTLPGALTFRGEHDVGPFRTLLEDLDAGRARSVVFAAPGGASWTLPLYELALLTAARLERPGRRVSLTIVTPEEAPLELFGAEASRAVRALLEARGIALRTGKYPARLEGRRLILVPGGELRADRVVAIPQLKGPRLPGIPHDADGFIPTDVHGRVEGLEDVYAAGDVTAFPVKQGGLAALQADAAAEAIAARAGAPVTPQPFRPVLRGLLLTGATPAFLRSELGGGRGATSTVASEPLWWPAGKIAGRYLGPYLATRAGASQSGRPAGRVLG